jgi:hypothetical protein
MPVWTGEFTPTGRKRMRLTDEEKAERKAKSAARKVEALDKGLRKEWTNEEKRYAKYPAICIHCWRPFSLFDVMLLRDWVGAEHIFHDCGKLMAWYSEGEGDYTVESHE